MTHKLEPALKAFMSNQQPRATFKLIQSSPGK